MPDFIFDTAKWMPTTNHAPGTGFGFGYNRTNTVVDPFTISNTGPSLLLANLF